MARSERLTAKISLSSKIMGGTIDATIAISGPIDDTNRICKREEIQKYIMPLFKRLEAKVQPADLKGDLTLEALAEWIFLQCKDVELNRRDFTDPDGIEDYDAAWVCEVRLYSAPFTVTVPV